MTNRAGLAQALAAGVLLMAPGCAPGTTAPSPDGLQGAAPAATAAAGSSSAAGLRKATLSTVTVTVTVVNVNPPVSVTVEPFGTAALPLDANAYDLTFAQNGNPLGSTSNAFQLYVTYVFPLESGGQPFWVSLSISGRPIPPACTIAGSAIGSFLNLQGTVETGNASFFELDVDDALTPSLVAVSAADAIYRCVGQAQGNCQAGMGPGAKVHVKGTFSGCNGSAPVVTATEVKVQKLP